MAAIDSRYYVHNSDKAALRALKAIPGFHQLMRAYLKIWSERQFRIMNMSSRVRMNDNQLAKYYNMLPPICDKLGIDLPELYLELDVNPNAYTFGDTNPFIVITSGLLETISDELVPTVLAHECGHIACHHVLYRTIGGILLGSTSSALSSFIPYGGIASLPLEVGFYYWMRCSEYSADRAAVICDGTPEKMTEVCMRLAGFDKDVNVIANKEEFLKQAFEYNEMVGTSKWDKTLEFLMFRKTDHPLMTVRALECEEWGKSEQFQKILDGTYQLEDITDEEPEQLDEEMALKQEKTRKPKGKLTLPKISVPFGKKDGFTSDEAVDQLELPTTFSAPDEIRKFKELMDDGIITEEEFLAKKKQLLGL